MGLACNHTPNLIVRKLFQFNKNLYLKLWAQRICFKTLLVLFLFEAWEQMLKFTSFKRQEINLVFKNKSFCWLQDLVF
jgi:hypothetical protein